MVGQGKAGARWSAWSLAPALAMVLAACADDGSASREGLDGPRLVLRPGDSLIDLLPLATWAAAPSSALPAELLEAAAGGLVMRSPLVPRSAWRQVAEDEVPPGWRPVLVELGDRPLWRAPSPLDVVEGAMPRRVIVDDREQPDWRPGQPDPPAPFITWDRVNRMLLCVADTPPERTLIDIAVDGGAELGDLALVPGPPSTLLSRRELGRVERPAILLPPPGAVDFAVDELRADRLHVALGLLDAAWGVTDEGVVYRRKGAGDGAVVALEVISPDGTVARPWAQLIPSGLAGQAWVEGEVDLSPWRGRDVVLRLVSEPGQAGDGDFDWVVVGDLRLRGGDSLRPPSRPHIVLIDIDTLRADRWGATMPRLSAWADRRAVVFEDAVSTAPWTLPATVSMFTGLAVHQHRVAHASAALPDGLTPLAERLARLGYETRAVAAGGYLRPTFGLSRGFERFEVVDPRHLDWSDELVHVEQRGSERPLFLFLHTYHVHAPYPYDPRHAPPDYDGPLAGADVDYASVIDPYLAGERTLSDADLAYMAALYDGLVRDMDQSVGAFVERLEQLFDGQPWLLVLTSDHGETFGEHGLLAHGQDLWAELLQVPLVVRFPDGRPGRRDDPASLIDLVPTVLDVLGLPPDPALPGRSLTRPVPSDRLRVASHVEDERLQSAQAADFKLIERRPARGDEAPSLELYDLGDDPRETRDLGRERPERAVQLHRRLAAWLDAHPPPVEAAGRSTLSDEVTAQLEALGYLGDG